MANEYSLQDANQNHSLIVASGTAGTAETRRLIGDENGLWVNVRAGTINIGTAIVNEQEATAYEGGTVAIGTTAVELTFTGATQAIQITSANANSGTIYIGASNITSAGANAIDELVAGQSLSIDFNDGTSPIYAVSTTEGQKVYKLALT